MFFPVAMANVNGDGTVNIVRGCSVDRVDVGEYDIVMDNETDINLCSVLGVPAVSDQNARFLWDKNLSNDAVKKVILISTQGEGVGRADIPFTVVIFTIGTGAGSGGGQQV